MKRILVKTYNKDNYNWPGTSTNPMRPVFFKHPKTGEETQCHYNDRNLYDNKDYEEAGFEYVEGKGWCWPVWVE